MIATASTEQTVATAAGATFRLVDADRRLRSVRLEEQVGLPAERCAFSYRAGIWRLRLPRPEVDRMEYLFEVADHNGRATTIPDPGNPEQAPGAFGPKSVVEFPGYRAPSWLDAATVPEQVESFALPAPALGGEIRGALWTPPELAGAAPLLVVHDGPEYAQLGSFTHYVGAMIAAGSLPPLRVALLAPGDRNRRYGADPAYAAALCTDVLPALDAAVPASFRIGVGVSLGALAMLHAHRLHPGTFHGLLLQSGSFFQPDLDPQEHGFSRFRPVTRFVTEVLEAVADADPVPLAVTCGAVEENLANNRRVTEALTGLGYEGGLHVVRDAHNYVAWRDALDPNLTDLVKRVVAHAA
jgi:enterochelin esterase-like enzyme